ncbi:hypothetical protein HYH03_010224 [Edaphochlamys debaryana]|uniref:Uncharacterized protein n=1 Tax=Edaphochlamys debaryana TaxID=47281 RepID=A0A835XYM9_9CHLO|nr:hypothetical protein HYH03_010224 [Edaphochlamys debaryana]|eukprot:KAG2491438.1 hypothetical protein HYH03_010224 [Edaphochlamys debaryana]
MEDYRLEQQKNTAAHILASAPLLNLYAQKASLPPAIARFRLLQVLSQSPEEADPAPIAHPAAPAEPPQHPAPAANVPREHAEGPQFDREPNAQLDNEDVWAAEEASISDGSSESDLESLPDVAPDTESDAEERIAPEGGAAQQPAQAAQAVQGRQPRYQGANAHRLLIYQQGARDAERPQEAQQPQRQEVGAQQQEAQGAHQGNGAAPNEAELAADWEELLRGGEEPDVGGAAAAAAVEVEEALDEHVRADEDPDEHLPDAQ